MTDLVVDTSVWVDAARSVDAAHVETLRKLVAEASIGITDVIYGELGVGHDRRATRTMLERFRNDDRILLTTSIDDFELALDCCRRSERTGRPVRSITDCLIAAVCIREAIPLLHADGDFDVLASCTDLQVVPV